MPANIGIISLGCAKNLIDTETMVGLLEEKGHVICGDETQMPYQDLIIINTCAFINAAKEESIEKIFEAVGYREENPDLKVLVAGCLAQRYVNDLKDELEEADGFLGTTRIQNVVEAVEDILSGKGQVIMVGDKDDNIPENLPKRQLTPEYQSYLKISEGCDNFCTYCVIPKIRGRHRSRSVEAVVQEAACMVGRGVQEIVLVGQDLTQYGTDTGTNLTSLLKAICAIDGDFKIRLLYCYPGGITDELIDLIATEDKILKYIDIPIQHVADPVLKRMGRRETGDDIRRVIGTLRQRVPGICVRSSVIVGFPGETAADFAELKEFVKAGYIDRLGVFQYSREENTPAYSLPDQVAARDKRSRLDQLMRAQQKVSKAKNQALLWSVQEVLVEEVDNVNHEAVGRTYRDAPDVDGTVMFRTVRDLQPGDVTMVRIMGAMEYDLTGVEELESAE